MCNSTYITSFGRGWGSFDAEGAFIHRMTLYDPAKVGSSLIRRDVCEDLRNFALFQLDYDVEVKKWTNVGTNKRAYTNLYYAPTQFDEIPVKKMFMVEQNHKIDLL